MKVADHSCTKFSVKVMYYCPKVVIELPEEEQMVVQEEKAMVVQGESDGGAAGESDGDTEGGATDRGAAFQSGNQQSAVQDAVHGDEVITPNTNEE